MYKCTKYVIVQLPRFDETGKAIPTTGKFKIKIDEFEIPLLHNTQDAESLTSMVKYRPVGFIAHKGASLHDSHYTYLSRDAGQWTEFDDIYIVRHHESDEHFLMEIPYLILAQQIKSTTAETPLSVPAFTNTMPDVASSTTHTAAAATPLSATLAASSKAIADDSDIPAAEFNMPNAFKSSDNQTVNSYAVQQPQLITLPKSPFKERINFQKALRVLFSNFIHLSPTDSKFDNNVKKVTTMYENARGRYDMADYNVDIAEVFIEHGIDRLIDKTEMRLNMVSAYSEIEKLCPEPICEAVFALLSKNGILLGEIKEYTPAEKAENWIGPYNELAPDGHGTRTKLLPYVELQMSLRYSDRMFGIDKTCLAKRLLPPRQWILNFLNYDPYPPNGWNVALMLRFTELWIWFHLELRTDEREDITKTLSGLEKYMAKFKTFGKYKYEVEEFRKAMQTTSDIEEANTPRAPPVISPTDTESTHPSERSDPSQLRLNPARKQDKISGIDHSTSKAIPKNDMRGGVVTLIADCLPSPNGFLEFYTKNEHELLAADKSESYADFFLNVLHSCENIKSDDFDICDHFSNWNFQHLRSDLTPIKVEKIEIVASTHSCLSAIFTVHLSQKVSDIPTLINDIFNETKNLRRCIDCGEFLIIRIKKASDGVDRIVKITDNEEVEVDVHDYSLTQDERNKVDFELKAIITQRQAGTAGEIYLKHSRPSDIHGIDSEADKNETDWLIISGGGYVRHLPDDIGYRAEILIFKAFYQ